MKSKSKGNIFWIIFLIICALFWGYKIITHIKTEIEHKTQFSMASANAVRYVSEKYGFEPEIKKLSADETFCEQNFMRLIAKYGDKEFVVFSDYLKENPVCADNYQYEEIKQAVTDKIFSEIPNGICADYSIATKINTLSGTSEKSAFGFLAFQTYYDGSNLDEVLKDCYGRIEMVFADADISDTAAANWLTEQDIDLEFTSLDTKEHLAEFEAFPSKHSILGYSSYAKFAPYITDHLEIEDGVEKHGLNISFQSCGDFIYTYFPTENKDFPVSREITIEEAHPDYFVQHYERYGEEEYVSAPITNAYACSDGWDIYIYYPLEKLKDYDIENIGAAWYSGGGQTNNRGIEKPSVCGDYAVFSLPFNKIEFMLVDTSGYDEYIPGWAKR